MPGHNENILINSFFKILKPRENLTCCAWADKYAHLPAESAAEHGKYSTDRTPYVKEILDTASDPAIKSTAFMSSAQVGKTTIIQMIVGYHADMDPCPILFVMPDEDQVKDYSRTRISNFFRDTPQLSDKLIDAGKERKSGNTLTQKLFPGGRLAMAGARSPADLSGKPIRILLCDEIDRSGYDEGPEGDPLKLAKKRLATFHNSFEYYSSTPGIQGLSRIEEKYNEGDQRKFYVPCPHCGKRQILRWGQLKYQRTDDKKLIKGTSKYECMSCRELIPESKKYYMLRHGKWIASKPFEGRASFWINELYSPWISWDEMAEDFINATKDRTKIKLREFTNLSLGEVWAEEGFTIEDSDILIRREDYAAEVPAGALVIVAAADVQDDRIEYEFIGYGEGEEAWSIQYGIIMGNPGRPEIWEELENILNKKFKHEKGYELRASCVCIDSGGHYTDEVYKFVKEKEVRRVFAVKGANVAGKPIVSRPNKVKYGVNLFTVGTDTAKELIYSRLSIEKPGPGYMHFPKLRLYNEEYFKQLTGEKCLTVQDKGGFQKKIWKRIRRNEVLDLRVYSLAALGILNVDWSRLKGHGPIGRTDTIRPAKKRRKIYSRGI